MCRLFGYRSNLPASVHRPLAIEKNSLRQQSHEHKDGWGIAHYDEAKLPSVVHGLNPAHSDPEFERISQLLSSRAVVAHIRLASIGPVHQRNAHPFLFGRWTFAHNGTVRDYARHQAALEERISARFREMMKGETDSERCFYLFLTQLEAIGSLEKTAAVADVARALAMTTRIVSEVTDRADAEKPTSLNFLVTDGELMVGTRRNKTLFFSECRGKADTVRPEHGRRLERLVIASEEMSVEDAWFEIPESSVIAVDQDLTLHLWKVSDLWS